MSTIQVDLLTYGLVLLLLAVNIWQILSAPNDDPSPRIYASMATAGTVYLLTFIVNSAIQQEVPNEYFFPAGPAVLFLGSATIVLLAVGLLALDVIRVIFIKLYRNDKVKERKPIGRP